MFRHFHVIIREFTINTLLSYSGVPRNFVGAGGSTNSVQDRENGDLGAVAL